MCYWYSCYTGDIFSSVFQLEEYDIDYIKNKINLKLNNKSILTGLKKALKMW
jgi:hypothetical protein